MTAPFAAVRTAAAPHIERLLAEWLPGGKRVGHEWVCGSANGERGRSLSINITTGVGADFAAGQKFADIVDVCAAVRHGGDKIAALRELGAMFGVHINGHATGARSTISAAPAPPKPAGKYVSAAPPPDAPPAPTLRGGTAHVYRDAAGAVLYFVWRLDATAERGKSFRSLSWGSLDGAAPAWHWKHPNPPRPLYGLDRLAARPGAPVILVEGEKAADAATEKFPAHVCVTWPGGADAVKNADWSALKERDVIIWPDNDAPGRRAAAEIAKRLPHAVILRVDDLPESADAADIDAPADPAAWLRARLPNDEPTGGDAEPTGGDADPPIPADDAAHRGPDDQVIPLGYDHGEFFYYSSSLRQVTALTAPRHTRAELCALVSQTYWYRIFRHHTAENGALSWPSIAAELMGSCRAAGVYDPDRVRGRGVWLDDGRVVAHLGDRLVVDGQPAPLVLRPSRWIYEGALPLLPGYDMLPPPLATREAIWLEKICRALRWEKKSAGRVLAGWIVLSMICGALDWRPSIWITASSGAGKSWVMREIVHRLLGQTSLFVAISTTEPSIRRMLKGDALSVIWEEGEITTRGDFQRFETIFGMLRAASSESGAVIARAAPDGGVDIFRVRTMMCFQSINTAASSQADIGRIEFLALRATSLPEDVPFPDVEHLVREKFTPDFGPRLFARSVALLPVIKENAKRFGAAIAAMPNQTQRRGDQLGALMAGAYSLHSERVVTAAEAARYAAEDDWTATEKPAPETSDERQCIATLLSRTVRLGPQEYSLGRLVTCAIGSEDDAPLPANVARQALLDHGIKLLEVQDVPGLAISTSHPTLRRLYGGTPWEASWGRALARIEGALPSSAIPTQRYGLGQSTRAVFVPLGAL